MFSCLVNPVDQFALMIGLPKRQPQSKPGTGLAAALLDLGERGVAVDMRLARPEQIQVGSVQNMDVVQCHLQSLESSRRTPDSQPMPVRWQGKDRSRIILYKAIHHMILLLSYEMAKSA